VPLVAEVDAEVATVGTVSPVVGLLGVVLIDLLLDGWKVAAPRLMGSTT
jgi:hypothetical protein